MILVRSGSYTCPVVVSWDGSRFEVVCAKHDPAIDQWLTLPHVGHSEHTTFEQALRECQTAFAAHIMATKSLALRHSDVARRLGVTVHHIRQLVRAGELGTDEGIITDSDIARLLEARI